MFQERIYCNYHCLIMGETNVVNVIILLIVVKRKEINKKDNKEKWVILLSVYEF